MYLNYYTYPEIKKVEKTTNGYCQTPDENFKLACDLIDKNQGHDELINMLKTGNIAEKQLAALKLDTLCSKDEAQTLVDNLTGQDGKIREAVSLKIAEFSSDKSLLTFFEPDKNFQTFLDAVIDINGNICRNTIICLRNFKSNSDFCKYFCPELLDRTLSIAGKVKDFDLKDGKYKVNKEVFKLYWYLETIYTFADRLDLTKLKQILNITKSINDYTIREKTAKILTLNFNDSKLNEIRQLLKNDTNYYVRRF